MKGIVNIFKNNYKIVIGLILGILISSISVYALENIAMIDSNEVDYDNTQSHGDYENVQDTIDELYKKVGFTGEKWKDPTLNGADPVLGNELIPVVISSKGDTYYANEYTEWYNYGQKRWANAVILVENTSKNYSPGDKIDENDIESYFVWIPRYKYRVWNTGNYDKVIPFSDLADMSEDSDDKYAIRNMFNNAQIIDIVFGDTTNVKVEDDTKQSGKSGDMSINIGDYLIHPAFTLGKTELNGIWVGKFETGYNQDGENENQITPDNSWTTEGAQKAEQDSTKIIIKPDVYSWRGATVKNFFMSAYEYETELKSHMMKNTEWGAVAYLSHSAYGIGGEVNINNNKNFKTGYSSYNVDQSTYPGTESTGEDGKTQPYNNATGYLASTTGNITGIYDMSGGSFEYTAAYVEGKLGESGFTDDLELKSKYKDYLDIYDATSSANSYDKRILGDATGEMGPFFNYYEKSASNAFWHNGWYGDNAAFMAPSSDLYWPIRGGIYSDGVLASQFSFTNRNGAAFENVSFRLVLSI